MPSSYVSVEKNHTVQLVDALTTDRQTYILTDRKTDNDTFRETDRQIDRYTKIFA